MGASLWRNRRFVALSSAQLLSSFGQWIMYLAIMVLIAVHWHRGPLAVSMGLVSLMGPGLLVHPYAGAWADRWDRKRVMIASNLLSAVAVLSILAVHDLWELYLALAFLGVIDAFFSPAESGMIKEVVPDQQMGRAMSIRMMIAQGTKIIGPSLSGVLVAWLGARIPFLIDGCAWGASAIIVMLIPGGRAHLWESSPGEPQPRYLDGFRYLARIPWLRLLVIFFAVFLLVLQMVDSQFVILVRSLPDASRLLGLTMSASGVGMGIAAAVVQKIRVIRPLQWMSSGAMAIGISFGLAAWLASVRMGWGIPLVVLGGGGAAALAMIPFQTTLQQKTPVEWTGRVQSAVGTASSASVAAGPILGGLLIARVGVVPGFLMVSVLLVIVGLMGSVLSLRLGGTDDAQSQPATQNGEKRATDLGR